MAELDQIINEPSEADKRINQLSGQVKSTSEERDAAKAEAEAAKAAAEDAERRAKFAEEFADIVAGNPNAKDFKSDIQAKVLSGYSVEDATYAVLGKAGKLSQPAPEPEAIAGGSANTTPPQTGPKSISEMTREEKLAALLEAESKGEIGMS